MGDDLMVDSDLVDDLVADIISDASKHVQVARESVDRLTNDERLLGRYGDFRLGLDFGGHDGRVLRADIHKALKAKGMSVRQIAAQTGVSPMTVSRDTAPPKPSVPDGTDSEREPVPTGTPTEQPADEAPPAYPYNPNPESWAALRSLLKTLEHFADAEAYAASVPVANRATTVRKLRGLGERLARIAWLLEGGVR